ncbi:D-amino-acid oxidase [Aspergillus insuetus]
MINIIVVVGAGVSGLTSALLLSKNAANRVTVVAKHMPGDYDIEYASPWAGANFWPSSSKEDSRWERRTWQHLKRLAEDVPEAGIHLQKSQVFRRNEDMNGPASTDHLYDLDPWYKEILPGYRELSSDEIPREYDSGCEFTSVCINTATYLQWLVGQCLKNGVVLKRGVLAEISQGKHMSHTGTIASIVVNATGLGSRTLSGVKDTTMAPALGQVVLVRNECPVMLDVSGTDDGEGERLYIMQRAGGGGTILGGVYQLGQWGPDPDMNTALRIMQRAVRLRPEIAGGQGTAGLDVIRHGVGLRPYRAGGVRIEGEKLDENTYIVHNYGHAGWGYQGSYGCAERVVELVDEVSRQVIKPRI